MAEPLALTIDSLETPIGELLLVVDGEGRLRAVDWRDHEDRMLLLVRRYCGPRGCTLATGRAAATAALGAYFKGDLAAIDRLPVASGGTEFQRRVWAALRRIPCGETVSYATLAKEIGHPSAVRAVGHANGANPVSVVVPCHRVIGADGTLTGYGGGLSRKSWLLAHEGAAFKSRAA